MVGPGLVGELPACRASSAPDRSELYVATGGKWVKTRVPSSPSHKNVWCGNRLILFQEIFCVRKYREPDNAMIWGSAAEKPNESGSHTSGLSMPNFSMK